jgi:hypothetical protein
MLFVLLRLMIFDWVSAHFSRLLGTALHVLFIIVWSIMKRFCYQHAPKVIWIYALAWCVYTNCSFRDWVPDIFKE